MWCGLAQQVTAFNLASPTSYDFDASSFPPWVLGPLTGATIQAICVLPTYLSAKERREAAEQTTAGLLRRNPCGGESLLSVSPMAHLPVSRYRKLVRDHHRPLFLCLFNGLIAHTHPHTHTHISFQESLQARVLEAAGCNTSLWDSWVTAGLHIEYAAGMGANNAPDMKQVKWCWLWPALLHLVCLCAPAHTAFRMLSCLFCFVCTHCRGMSLASLGL